MPFISAAAVITFLLLLALQQRNNQVTAQPVRRPVTASTAVSHIGTLSVQSGVRGLTVVFERGKLFTFVKM